MEPSETNVNVKMMLWLKYLKCLKSKLWLQTSAESKHLNHIRVINNPKPGTSSYKSLKIITILLWRIRHVDSHILTSLRRPSSVFTLLSCVARTQKPGACLFFFFFYCLTQKARPSFNSLWLCPRRSRTTVCIFRQVQEVLAQCRAGGVCEPCGFSFRSGLLVCELCAAKHWS